MGVEVEVEGEGEGEGEGYASPVGFQLDPLTAGINRSSCMHSDPPQSIS